MFFADDCFLCSVFHRYRKLTKWKLHASEIIVAGWWTRLESVCSAHAQCSDAVRCITQYTSISVYRDRHGVMYNDLPVAVGIRNKLKWAERQTHECSMLHRIDVAAPSQSCIAEAHVFPEIGYFFEPAKCILHSHRNCLAYSVSL